MRSSIRRIGAAPALTPLGGGRRPGGKEYVIKMSWEQFRLAMQGQLINP
ncbi:MAG: hypothetical protein JO247_04240 [Chloroflexi bacterium]|nr:hypothetical protein [Chloroflexota bacterium]